MSEGPAHNLRSQALRRAIAAKTPSVPLKKKRKNDAPAESPGTSVAPESCSVDSLVRVLEPTGVSLSPATRRSKLVTLVNKYVRKKKAKPDPSQPKNSRRRSLNKSVQEKNNDCELTDQMAQKLMAPHPLPMRQYVEFDEAQLVGMLQALLVPTAGLDKGQLVELCKTYNDLIVLPSEKKNTTEARYSLRQGRQVGNYPNLGSDDEVQLGDGMILDEDASRSKRSTILPSLEHGTLLFPRPRPTNLFASSSKTVRFSSSTPEYTLSRDDEEWLPNSSEKSDNRSDTSIDNVLQESPIPSTSKGKGKARAVESTESTQPTISVSHASLPELYANPPKPDPDITATTQPPVATGHPSLPNESFATFTSKPPEDNFAARQDWNTQSTPVSAQQTVSMLEKIEATQKKIMLEIRAMNFNTNKVFERLTNDIRMLSVGVKGASGLNNLDNSQEIPLRTGRLSERVRFHVQTLLGQKERDPPMPLPAPASDEEKQSWRKGVDLHALEGTVNIDPPLASSTDPYFPYEIEGGPGNSRATPQQLAFMYIMLLAVGIRSFRPDFGAPLNTEDNKWLWEVAQIIFMKMVACGLYPGLSLETVDVAQVEKCFKGYVRETLQRRYREQNHSPEDKSKRAGQVRQASRLRYLKSCRDQVILTNKELIPLGPLVTIACSDDETDLEDEGRSKRRIVRKLEWRSTLLSEVFAKLDLYRCKLDASNPGTSSGAPPRPRIRVSEAPISRIKPPSGLPVDCVCPVWYGKQEAKYKRELALHPVPILPKLNNVLSALL